MIPKIEIDQEIIKINALSIGSRKMTKSVFNQIIEQSPLNQSMSFIGDSIIGFVNDSKGRYLLFTKNGELRKSSLTTIHKIAGVNGRTVIADFRKLEYYFRYSVEGLSQYDIHNDDVGEPNIAAHYSPDILERVLKVASKAGDFLKEAYARQIFIAN